MASLAALYGLNNGIQNFYNNLLSLVQQKYAGDNRLALLQAQLANRRLETKLNRQFQNRLLDKQFLQRMQQLKDYQKFQQKQTKLMQTGQLNKLREQYRLMLKNALALRRDMQKNRPNPYGFQYEALKYLNDLPAVYNTDRINKDLIGLARRYRIDLSRIPDMLFGFSNLVSNAMAKNYLKELYFGPQPLEEPSLGSRMLNSVRTGFLMYNDPFFSGLF